MAGGKTWGWPKVEKEGRRSPADYEREAAERRAKTSEGLGVTGTASAAAEVPRIFSELRSITLGEDTESVDRAPANTGYSLKHDDNPNTTAVLDELVETGELRNN